VSIREHCVADAVGYRIRLIRPAHSPSNCPAQRTPMSNLPLRKTSGFSRSQSVKVLFIAGSGRSGSTLLCQILGGIDGLFCAGELSDFWERYVLENQLCACGEVFRSCKVWSRIIQEGAVDTTSAYAQRAATLRAQIGLTQHLPLLLAPPTRAFMRGRLVRYMSVLESLYGGIRAGTGARVVVDSSKFPSYGWVLGQVPGIELFVVHLVRDPRGVAFSWLRSRPPHPRLGRVEVPRFGPVASSIRWLLRNAATEALWGGDPLHYILLRYEDFITDPEKALGRILKLVDEASPALPLIQSHRVHLGDNHIVWGNRTRFQRGDIELRLDTEWQERIKKPHKAIVEVMSWPLMRRYGYSLRETHRVG